ncbi:MAG: sigma-70 family RNA polymerase sigma factor [Bryobacterales bacterium]|nr:sigma-70 family RNA polymerase sigma factor [Bryobacterales bacterium]
MSDCLLSSSSSTSRTAGTSAVGATQWTELVHRIRNGDDSGIEELYRLFSRGIRFYICRQLGSQELEDRVHDTFLIVLQAIQKGELREPERLMGFVRTIVRRQIATHIGHSIHQRRDSVVIDQHLPLADDRKDPEQMAIVRQRTELARKLLSTIPPRDREILTRFYLLEQPQEQICREMNLTDTQFRLFKSRAKARFGELGKRRIGRSGLVSFFLRTSSAAIH